MMKFMGIEFSPVGYLPEDCSGINKELVEIAIQVPDGYTRKEFREMCADISPLPSVFRCESGDYAGKIIVPGKKSLYIYSGAYKPLDATTEQAEAPADVQPVDAPSVDAPTTETNKEAQPAKPAEPVKEQEAAGTTVPAVGTTEPPASTTVQAEKTEAQKKDEEQKKKERERVAALSPEAAAEEAAKRVKTDTERLTGHNMRVMVGKHIERKCSNDPEFSRLVLQPGKKMEPDEFPLAVALHMADAIASRFDDAMEGVEASEFALGKATTATAPEPFPADIVSWSRENCFGFIDACGDGSLDPCCLAFNMLRALIGEAAEKNVRDGSDPATDRGFGACSGGLRRYVCNMTYYLRALKNLLGVPLTERNILVCGMLSGLGRAAKWQAQERHRKAPDGSWENYIVYVPNETDYGAPLDGPAGPRAALWANALMDGNTDTEELIALMYVEGAHGTQDKNTVGHVFDEHPMAFLTHLAHLASAFGSNY